MCSTSALTSQPARAAAARRGEGEQAPGQGGGAGRAFHRIVEGNSTSRRSPGQPAAERVEVADDHREHVVEVVGDAAGELADRLHLLGLARRSMRVCDEGR